MKREEITSEAKVRPARHSDASAIHTLAEELAVVVGDETPPLWKVSSRLGELLEGESSGVLVAVIEERVVGVVSFWLKPDLAHGDRVVEVPMLAVSSANRRGGVGRALIAAVTEHATNTGASIVELTTTPSNVSAREFYRSLGFVETDHLILEFFGEEKDPPGAPPPEIL